MPLNQVKEITALFKNINAEWTELVAGSFAAQLVFGTIKQTLKSIVGFITAMNKNQFFKQVIGLVATFATILTTVKLIKLLMVDIGKLFSAAKVFEILQPSTFLNAPQQAGLAMFLGKASPLLNVLGGVAAGIGTIVVGVNAMKSIAQSRQEKEAILQADNLKKLHDINAKVRSGTATEVDLRTRNDIIGSPLLGHRVAGSLGETMPEIKFKIEITGKTDMQIEDEVEKWMRPAIEKGIVSALLRHGGQTP
jgi:hypothetical protein